jgi:hypothetical protein
MTGMCIGNHSMIRSLFSTVQDALKTEALEVPYFVIVKVNVSAEEERSTGSEFVLTQVNPWCR